MIRNEAEYREGAPTLSATECPLPVPRREMCRDDVGANGAGGLHRNANRTASKFLPEDCGKSNHAGQALRSETRSYRHALNASTMVTLAIPPPSHMCRASLGVPRRAPVDRTLPRAALDKRCAAAQHSEPFGSGLAR
jgi:hypothetical protein